MGTSLRRQLSKPVGRAKAEAQAVHPQNSTLHTDSNLKNLVLEQKIAHHVIQKPYDWKPFDEVC